MNGEKRRNVYFSLEDEMERELYEFAGTINFSQFAKRFLRLEYDRRQQMAQIKTSITLGERR